MRFIAVILIAYVLLLTVSPAVCKTYTALKQVNLCGSSNDKQSTKEQSGNKQSNNNTSCTDCCSIQNCHCNFVDVPQFNFLAQTSVISKKTSIKNDKVLSNYLSDCWHPPKNNLIS